MLMAILERLIRLSDLEHYRKTWNEGGPVEQFVLL